MIESVPARRTPSPGGDRPQDLEALIPDEKLRTLVGELLSQEPPLEGARRDQRDLLRRSRKVSYVMTQLPRDAFVRLARIGEGAAATIYKSLWKQGESYKLCAERVITDPTAKRDAAIARKLLEPIESEYLVKTMIQFSCGKEEIYVQPLLDRSLRDFLLQEGEAGRERLPSILVGAAQGLADLHTHGLIHRDIGEDNICLTFQGEGRLIDYEMVATKEQAQEDFDSRKLLEVDDDDGWSSDDDEEWSFSLPESDLPFLVADNREPESPKSDIYAFGTMILRLTSEAKLVAVGERCTAMELTAEQLVEELRSLASQGE